MKRVLPFILILICNGSFSQNLIFHCKYAFKTATDSINPTSEIYNLEANNVESKYYSETKRLKDSTIRDNYKKGLALDEILANSSSYNTGLSSVEIYNNATSKSLVVYEDVLSIRYQYKDSINPTKWMIFNDTLSINGILCQLAKLNFRGREYFAWFAPSIPIPFGPWKFYGLPGLIFRVSDKTKKYSFELIEFQKEQSIKQLSTYQGKSINTTLKEVTLLKKRLIEDPIGQLEMATGAKITINSGSEQLMSGFKKDQSKYQPLELSFEDN